MTIDQEGEDQLTEESSAWEVTSRQVAAAAAAVGEAGWVGSGPSSVVPAERVDRGPEAIRPGAVVDRRRVPLRSQLQEEGVLRAYREVGGRLDRQAEGVDEPEPEEAGWAYLDSAEASAWPGERRLALTVVEDRPWEEVAGHQADRAGAAGWRVAGLAADPGVPWGHGHSA